MIDTASLGVLLPRRFGAFCDFDWGVAMNILEWSGIQSGDDIDSGDTDVGGSLTGLPASGNCLQPGAEHVGECSRQATKVGWHTCGSLKLTMPLLRLGFGCAGWATSLR